MNLDAKLERLNELKKINFPSDQIIEQILKLEEEIKIILKDNNIEISSKDSTQEEREELKRTVLEYFADKIREKRGGQRKHRYADPNKKSILIKIIDRLKEKPVTQAELDELRKLVYKY